MRLTHFVAGLLIFLLLIGAVIAYINPLSPDRTPSDKNRIEEFVSNDSRFQGIHFHEEQGELSLVYLYSYEPISKRFSAIYIPPQMKVVSSSFTNVRSLKSLYKSMTPADLSDELSIVADVPIPFWSVTKNDQLAKIIDLTGGTRLPDPETAVNINLQKNGRLQGQWMDGSMTLDYVSNSYRDFGIQGLRYRHKTFFLGYLQSMTNQTYLFNAEETYRRIHNTIETNYDIGELQRLSNILMNLKSKKIKFPALSGQVSPQNPQHLSSDRVQKMLPRPLKQIIEEADKQKKIRVQVLNGAGVSGLAGDLRDYLQKFPNIDVVEVGNADRYDHETSQIIDRSGNPQSAYRLMEILKAGEYQSEPSESLMVDVTVVVGRDLKKLRYK